MFISLLSLLNSSVCLMISAITILSQSALHSVLCGADPNKSPDLVYSGCFKEAVGPWWRYVLYRVIFYFYFVVLVLTVNE